MSENGKPLFEKEEFDPEITGSPVFDESFVEDQSEFSDLSSYHNDFIGKTVGQFKLEGIAGEGAFSVVFRALDKNLGIYRAFKMFKMNPFEIDTGADLMRLKKEARIASCFNHPNICKVYSFDYIREKDFPIPYIVMDFVEGLSVRNLLEKMTNPMPEVLCLAIFIQCLEALSYAFNTPVSFLDHITGENVDRHYSHITHRDIKPENILVNSEGCRIIDFGIAKTYGNPDPTYTGKGMAIGTLQYMSPEAAIGKEIPEDESFKNDLYSLCVMLYEMAVGKYPFITDNISSLAMMVQAQKYEMPKCNPSIADIIVKGMARKYQSYEDIISEARNIFSYYCKSDPADIIQQLFQAIDTKSSTSKAFSQYSTEATRRTRVQAARKPRHLKLKAAGIGISAVLAVGAFIAYQQRWMPFWPAPVNTPKPVIAEGTGKKKAEVKPLPPKPAPAIQKPTAKKKVRKRQSPVSRRKKKEKPAKAIPVKTIKEDKGLLYAKVKQWIASGRLDMAYKQAMTETDPAFILQKGIVAMRKENLAEAISLFNSIKSNSRLEPFSTVGMGLYYSALCNSSVYNQAQTPHNKNAALEKFILLKNQYKGKIPDAVYERLDDRIDKVRSF